MLLKQKAWFRQFNKSSISNKNMSACNVPVNLSQSHMIGYRSILPRSFSCCHGIFLLSQRKPSADLSNVFLTSGFHILCCTLDARLFLQPQLLRHTENLENCFHSLMQFFIENVATIVTVAPGM